MEEDPASGGEGDYRDCACPDYFNPVCGFNDQNYQNPCFAICDNVETWKCLVNWQVQGFS